MPILRWDVPLAPRRARQLRAEAAARARRANIKLLVLAPVFAAVVALYVLRRQVFGVDAPVRIPTAVIMAVVGSAVATQIGHALAPRLLDRFEPGTAGVAAFVMRLIAVTVILVVALSLAGVDLSTLAVGASFSAVFLGLAAQQTVGNVLAGVVLLSARPFSVGDRVRFNGFGMDVEGTVAAHGLLYVTMHDGQDLVMVPNNTALTMSVRPIREPAAVDMRARLPHETDPEAVQQAVGDALSVPVRDRPHVGLEEFDGDEVIVRIRAVPSDPAQGAALAREVLRAVTAMSPDEAGAATAGAPG